MGTQDGVILVDKSYDLAEKYEEMYCSLTKQSFNSFWASGKKPINFCSFCGFFVYFDKTSCSSNQSQFIL